MNFTEQSKSCDPETWDCSCIHEVFEKRVECAPDAIAISFGEEQLSYHELNERANQVAHHLRSFQVGPEVPVALCLDRSLELVIAIVAVLKSGGAYVPLDLAYPKERLRFILEDSEASVTLTQRNLVASLPPNAKNIICLDSDWKSISEHSKTNPVMETTPDNAAYIIFTSGSTGKPKGVVVTHNNVVRLFSQTHRWYGFNSTDVWALFHSYAFDMSVWELWGALLFGGRLVVVPYKVSRSPEAFYELMGREGITVLNQTPSAFRPLIWADVTAKCKQPLVLRWIIFGGEALELQSLKPWFDAHGDKKPQLVNKYGITETSVHSTYRPISMADLAGGLGSVIGVPIPDLTIHLLDENLSPVPIGTPGEICVGGAGVARGYLKRPDLTRTRFIKDPFSDKDGARLYRSGDLARRLENGDLEYLGRIDHQIKIRGFRVELGEIEAVLNQHPAVRESVVIGVGSQSGDKRLIAYLVAGPQALSVTELREHVKGKLPDYMIPAQFVFLDALPLTPNGKTDRQALPAPDKARPSLMTPYLAPQSSAERGLAKIWSQVLELEPIGINDSFFELGGDSIRSIALLARAREGGYNFSLQDLFDHPTISTLATCLGASKETTESVATAPFSLITEQDRNKLPGDLEDAYPMLMLQVGMFYHNDLNPASAIYYDVFSFRIEFPFVRENLERAIAQFVARHPTLRTSFALDHFSEPLQLVHKTATVPLILEDFQHLSPDEQSQALDRFIGIEQHTPMDRTRAPLLRAAVQLCSPQSFQLIVSFHHAILDGWSLAALLTELLHDYAVLVKGTGLESVPPRLGYCDYVALERKAIRSETCRRFWTEKVQDLPVQRLPRWPKPLRGGGFEQKRGPEIQISSQMLGQLKELAQKAGAPLKSVLQAAHFRVLNLLHGASDIISGLVTNGRPEEVDGERLIGLCLNTVPMRVELNGGTWLQLIQQVFIAERELLPFRRFPLIEIRKQAGGQSLFETAFDFNYFHVYKNLQGHEDLGFLAGHYAESNSFTLFTTFILDVITTQLEMHCDYDPEELCADQIKRISEYYLRTLEAMILEPNARYEHFSPLSSSERNQLLVEWNNTQREFLPPKTIHGLFQAQVKRTPDAVAVVDGAQRLSYRELDQRSNQLAHRLVSLGIGPEMLVGICMDRSLWMVIGLLGILKAGGAYVPLDPAYPKERLAFILEDTEAAFLLTKRNLVNELPAHSAQVVFLDEPIAEANFGVIEERAAETDLAYIIYTSGSTGRPKGVAIEHRNTAALIHWAKEVYSTEELAGVLASTSICFDLSVFELFATLSWGGKVILAENALQLAELPSVSEVTLINTVPSAVPELLRLNAIPDSVRTVNLAGELLQTTLVQQIYQKQTISKVYDLYGPSEDTTYSTFALRAPDCPATIGRPLLNKQVYILDTSQEPVPVGVAGEIYIGGDGVARGYLKRPELTAQKFIKDPFSPKPGARLYRTGDLGRYRLDGTIEFLGRIDRQVKIRGFRVELGEIESVLARHPGVSEAAVLAREEVPRQGLVAYVVANANMTLSFAELREFIKTSLPDFMVPTGVVFLQSLPLTQNGKIDRKALLALECDRLSIQKSYVGPRNEVERILTEVWQTVLRMPQIGIHDNFFELGGHSLLATQVVSRIRRLLHREVTLRSLFEHPTVADLSAVISPECRTEEGALKTVSREGELPLSFAQQRLWFLDRLEGGVAYVLRQGIRLDGPLNASALEASLNEIVRRHETLRTVFPDKEGRTCQTLLPSTPVDLPQVDLSHLSSVQRETEANRLAIREASEPFDIQHGPVIRTKLLRLDNENHILLLNMHHIASDGWSCGIFLNELSALYQAFSEGRTSPLPELSIQYADFAAWQRDLLAGKAMDEHVRYWKKQLNNAPPLSSLLADHPRPQNQSYRGACEPIAIKAPLVESFKRICQQKGCTLYMGLLAAFEVVVYRLSGQSDLLVGTPIANRNRSEIEGLIGCFINTLVLRTDLGGKPSFRQLLGRVREVTLEAYAHQDLPFEKLIEEIQPMRHQSYSPLFQLMLVLQNTPLLEPTSGKIKFKPFDVENGTTKYDLTVALNETSEGLHGVAEYACDLFETATIQRFIRLFSSVISGIVENPDQEIDALPLLSAKEADCMLQWGSMRAQHPQSPSLPELIEKQVNADPDAVAVVAGATKLSYGELNRRASQIAERLRAAGTGRDKFIGISIERSFDMIVGLLGILKSGGAFVPLDPDLPQERLRFMIDDSGITVVLAQKKHVPKLPVAKAQLLVIDEPGDELCITPSFGEIGPSDAAYLIYTSGSTGNPKGVVVEHGPLVQHCLDCQEHYQLTAQDRVLQFASLNFDASLEQIFPTLMSGASVILRDGDLWTSNQFAEKVIELGLTVINLPPAYWRQLATDWAALAPPGLPDQVRLVLVGGEEMPAQAVDLWQRTPFNQVRLLNSYGPTEAVITATDFEVPPRRSGCSPIQRIPIGRVRANRKICVLDSCGKPVPVGVSGELHIGGSALARGYLNRPELTAEKFIKDSFGDRLYKTGDMVRYLPDGNLEYLGRIDQQIKIRGFRIELGEIESVLQQHPEIRAAAVVAAEGSEKRLAAYYVPKELPGPACEDLRQFTRSKLPEYMVPSAFTVMEKLPLTAGGKIDRKALPKPQFSQKSKCRVLPSTPEETALAQIWCEVLGLNQVDIHDNFFELGGHSLFATQVISRAQSLGFCSITLKDVFEKPTIAALSKHLIDSKKSGFSGAIPGLAPLIRKPRN